MPPSSTYRLQLRREFGFRQAADVVPYLTELGISHVYCSPVLEAVPGSEHGYDVIRHDRLSSELGGDGGWAELVAACRAHRLGLIVDVVPNHMAVPAPEDLNAALWDVLRLGPASAFAHWFDIDWSRHGGDGRGGRLLMPVLGRSVDDCVDAGELHIDRAAGVVHYFEHRFPVAPDTVSLLDNPSELLAAQHYRLARWQTAVTELNYRRFFDVTSLIGLRVEQPDVFAGTHARLLELVSAGDVDGLRIDHPDGLADPAGYLGRLGEQAGPVWTVVEKILETSEELPASWRCAGTTGYDAIAAVTRALVDPAGELPLTDIYTSLTGAPAEFDTVVVAAKRQVIADLFPAEVARLVRDLAPVRDGDTYPTPAFTDDSIAAAVVELLVAFDVYRAYAGDLPSRSRVDAAEKVAIERRPDQADEIRWVSRLLRREDTRAAAEAFAVRFEQTTGPVMAKGVEDTAFYRYHRLVALNEVGGDPATFGGSVASWHDHCARLARDRPAAMTTLSTHDTKRSEDVRARLLVLAEIPADWRVAVDRWSSAARRHGPVDANTDYLFWQTLVGAWPLTVERMQDYLTKATREAKQHTSWRTPDGDYDERLRGYVARVFADEALMGDVGGWVESFVQAPGSTNALAQKLLQLTMPGIPDVYQGQELTDRSLVDPDNRRPVDYDHRREALGRLDRGPRTATVDDPDIEAKLRVTATALRLRRRLAATFAGSYTPVEVTGPAAAHAIAYRRSAAGTADVIVVTTRLPVGLARRGGWGSSRLQTALDGGWREVLTGRPGTIHLGELLTVLPVALLVQEEG